MNANMIRGYIECALWSSTGYDGEPLDGSDVELSSDAREQMEKDCAEFADVASDHIQIAIDNGASWSTIGHDFWLTRNGHGAGFWDRNYADKSTLDALSDAARKCGSRDLYVGDDGEIYQS